MHLQQTSIQGEDFVGLFGMATDKYAILSENFPECDVLGVPVYRTKIYGTNLVGLFCSGNSNGLLLPYFVSDEELKKIKDFVSQFGVVVEKVFDKHTATGNMIACNDKAAIVSPRVLDASDIEDALGVEVIQCDIALYEEVGSCCIATSKGFLVHPEAEETLAELEKIFKVPGLAGSVNFGFPFVKSGVIANSSGYVTGTRTSGIELGRIDEALGFLD
ncbi:MAG: hypothetical protein MSIBF_04250 [Candidatus Altiarchaeales archaeon IMC4]|nr:MAG: hypothetical protein MSIBF_04250 [Candidatus Altiarchaeales archaeon IMC4]